MKYFRISLVFIISLLTAFGTAMAQQSTKVVVRVKAKDAKFVGSSVGGALVTIRNANTGELMAKGLTKGSTGNTKKLVMSPKKRYEQLSTKGSAKFTARLNLDKPVFVTVSATSTYRNEQEVTSSTQLWLIPGHDVAGDGIILEMPGFIVDILKIKKMSGKTGERQTKIKASVVMMCGCPTRPGGLWDSSKFTIKALVKKEGEVVQTVPMTFSGKSSVYVGKFAVPAQGRYKVLVYAFDARTENSGVAIEMISFD